MVAYSFNPQFEMPIRTLRKTGTIRGIGARRHARPGESLQLYTGMRTKSCRLIARAVCDSAEKILLDFSRYTIQIGESVGREVSEQAALDSFAQGDGFSSFEAMAQFWRETHGATSFNGIWIRWLPSTLKTEI